MKAIPFKIDKGASIDSLPSLKNSPAVLRKVAIANEILGLAKHSPSGDKPVGKRNDEPVRVAHE